MCRKIDKHTVSNSPDAFHVVHEDIPFGWIHENDDVERTPHDSPRDYNGCVRMKEKCPQMNGDPGPLHDMRGINDGSGDVNAKMQRTTARGSLKR